MLVILDVIASSTESKTDKSFEYLNLPPNLLTSIEREYCVRAFETPVLRLSGSSFKLVL